MLSSLQFVLAGLAFGSAGGFTPGPTITLVISQTLRHGVREGFKIAISPLITDAPIILLAIFVLRSIDVEPVLETFPTVHQPLGQTRAAKLEPALDGVERPGVDRRHDVAAAETREPEL